LSRGFLPAAVCEPSAGSHDVYERRALLGAARGNGHTVLPHLLFLAAACVVAACGTDPRQVALASSPADGAQSPPAGDGDPVTGDGSPVTGDGASGDGAGSTPAEPNPSQTNPTEAVPGDVPLAGAAGSGGNAGPGEPMPVPPVACTIVANAGSATDGDVNIDLNLEFQRIAGFGGMDGGFYPELTAAQVDSAFGNGPGQIGLSIIRIRIPETEARFPVSVAAAARASQLGALVMATPWSPPAGMKSNNSTVAGELNVASYGAYADHLLSYRDFMQANGVPLYAISMQNEPDIEVDYESCDWTPQQVVDWIKSQGSKFEGIKLMAPESFQFNRAWSDPILQDPEAAAHVDIIGGHVYGGGVADYPLAREQGKEVWMTEHYHDSANPANQWPLALGIGTDVHRSMSVNFNAYVWWAIRRAYGLLTEDGVVSKRGYVMAQYSKFVRPGFVRVSTTAPASAELSVTAYKGGDQLVVVALNRATTPQAINLDVFNGCATQLSRFTTSASLNLAEGAPVALVDGRATVTLDAESATTFVSQ
jgi:glucuronoarabinoxylan endo-1,4-beta-xylanase